MKKIVFSNLPMTERFKLHYPVDGNKSIEYDGEVTFPVIAVLARTLAKGDDVKVVLLSKESENGTGEEYSALFQSELNEINRSIGANIEYVIIPTPFVETREIHEKLFCSMVDKLEDDAEIIGDITYGPKPLPIIMFSVMNFAERFFHAEIKNIIYGRVEFIKGEREPKNPMIFDLTPLYYLNALTNAMEFSSSAEAVKALKDIIDFR